MKWFIILCSSLFIHSCNSSKGTSIKASAVKEKELIISSCSIRTEHSGIQDKSQTQVSIVLGELKAGLTCDSINVDGKIYMVNHNKQFVRSSIKEPQVNNLKLYYTLSGAAYFVKIEEIEKLDDIYMPTTKP